MTHLSDETINEYLDENLAPGLRAEVEAHLTICPPCSARLDELYALFASLDSLPNLPLEVDFAPVILARLEQSTRLPGPIRWLTAIQAISAVFAASLAWPLAKTMLPAWNLPDLSDIFPQWATSLLQIFSQVRLPNVTPHLSILHLVLPTNTLTMTMLGAALLWLATNGLLLIPGSRRSL